MLRDNLLGLIEPMQISAGVDPLALTIQKQASDDRPSCLENPRPERAESSLTENVTSPFQAEPAQTALMKTVSRCCIDPLRSPNLSGTGDELTPQSSTWREILCHGRCL